MLTSEAKSNDLMDEEALKIKLKQTKNSNDRYREDISFFTDHIRALERNQKVTRHKVFPDVYDLQSLSESLLNSKHKHSFTISKKSTEKKIARISLDQAFFLEIECLRRLNELGEEMRRHFPALLSIDIEARSFNMSHCGTTIKDLIESERKIEIKDLELQIVEIITALREASVMHLDMHNSGKNITISDSGLISLIDFDVAVYDDFPLSGRLRSLNKKRKEKGGYDYLEKTIISLVKKVLS